MVTWNIQGFQYERGWWLSEPAFYCSREVRGMSDIWILDIHGLSGWLPPFLQLANDLRDFGLIHVHIVKITQQVADKVDDVRDIKQILAKTRRLSNVKLLCSWCRARTCQCCHKSTHHTRYSYLEINMCPANLFPLEARVRILHQWSAWAFMHMLCSRLSAVPSFIIAPSIVQHMTCDLMPLFQVLNFTNDQGKFPKAKHFICAPSYKWCNC